MKTIIIDETKERKLYELLSASKNVDIFDTPLEAFASQEAEFRINKIVKNDPEEIPGEKLQDCIEDAAYSLAHYLINDETALNYDGIDETIRESIEETLSTKMG